ncbi:non-specific lipid-transfer protein 1-like [Cornus florida]|uniref:non-specific lipid-transfer protein 1-like n=1 Tax=Cornus florida TaxID=4283 RepID=UPI00289CBE0C|nr:non-specific lipid-transfer protein 1-like [Cornus florida]
MGCSLCVFGLAVLVVIASPVSVNGIECGDAITKMIPCESYLTGAGAGAAVPSTDCCEAAQGLDKIAEASIPERRALCECFKQTARSFPVNRDRVKQLPQLCKINISIAIDPSVDCKK